MMMARGLFVVDENLSQLVEPLKDIGIRIIVPKSGQTDEDIAKSLLPSRIFVTRNTKDFIKYIPGYSIGIISLEGLKFIDGEKQGSSNKTVQIISESIVKYELWSRADGFLLELRNDGNHVFKAPS